MRNTLKRNQINRLLLIALTGLILTFFSTVNAEEIPRVEFTVKKFIVEGENPLSEKVTQKILAPFLGKHTGILLLESAAEALEETLHDRHYSFHRVVIPPQKAKDGMIRLKVISFKLDKIVVEGNNHFTENNILASLPALCPGKTLNALSVARSLHVANEHPSKRVAAFIRDSEVPEHINARIESTDIRPQQLFSSIANTGTPATGRNRLSLGYQHSNLFDLDHIMTLSYTTSPDYMSQVQQYGIHYRLPLYRFASGLSLFYSHSKVDQGTVADFFQVSGKGAFSGISFDHTLLPIDDYNHKITVGLQDRLFQNHTSFVGFPIGVDVRSRPFTLRYQGGWQKTGGSLDFHMEYARNIASGRHNDNTAYIASRAGANRNFDLFRFGVDFDYTLPKNWRLQCRLSGQQADEPLLSGEQFGLGGIRSVRGFEERESTGESGQQMNVEIWTPPIVYDIRLLAFTDAGRRHLENALAGQKSTDSLSSCGLGVRWGWKAHIGLSLDLAYVIDGAYATKRGDGKAHFNVFYRF